MKPIHKLLSFGIAAVLKLLIELHFDTDTQVVELQAAVKTAALQVLASIDPHSKYSVHSKGILS